MKKIVKQKEPKEWTDYRRTSGVGYESIPELRQSLLKEQGFICAYCMRRIPCKDRNSNESSRIDHIKCRETNEDKELDYKNMVVCCPGAISEDFHCDKSKGNKEITFTPFDDDFISSLKYSSRTGKISSSSEEWDKEINEVLNLNNDILQANRLETLFGVIDKLGKFDRRYCNQILHEWDNKDKDGRYKAFCGIVIWFLRKKLFK